MERGIHLTSEPEPWNIQRIGERFRGLRIVDPSAERSILRSMEHYGQLSPVVVCRLEAGCDELLDGFKRLNAARSLSLETLTVRRLSAGPRACKAAMLQLNRVGRNISSMEEALVVHSLCHEDGLSQVEIAGLLGRHKSWVSRRVALIARLCDEVQEHIRLGLLPASLGTELARLQRRNQQQVLDAIVNHHLTWRETRKMVTAVLKAPQSIALILRDPRAFSGKPEGVQLSPADEQGLGPEAKSLLRVLLGYEKSCLEAALTLSSITLGRWEENEAGNLRLACGKVLAALVLVEQELHIIMGGGDGVSAQPGSA